MRRKPAKRSTASTGEATSCALAGARPCPWAHAHSTVRLTSVSTSDAADLRLQSYLARIEVDHVLALHDAALVPVLLDADPAPILAHLDRLEDGAPTLARIPTLAADHALVPRTDDDIAHGRDRQAEDGGRNSGGSRRTLSSLSQGRWMSTGGGSRALFGSEKPTIQSSTFCGMRM